MKKLLGIAWIIMLPLLGCSPADSAESLSAAIDSAQRAPENRLRDGYRHPEQTLQFFAVDPRSRVLEVWPGRGWYTEILAPWILHSGGQYIAAGFPAEMGPEWRQALRAQYLDWLAANASWLGEPEVVDWGPQAWDTLPASHIDTALTFRNFHNWLAGDFALQALESLYRALKPGGVLGIVDHRAEEGTPLETMIRTGYVTESLVIAMAQQAGFEWIDRSEINANPLDSKDHPHGVWSLAPSLRGGEKDRAQYIAIGESDRFTLKFRKPDETNGPSRSSE